MKKHICPTCKTDANVVLVEELTPHQNIPNGKKLPYCSTCLAYLPAPKKGRPRKYPKGTKYTHITARIPVEYAAAMIAKFGSITKAVDAIGWACANNVVTSHYTHITER